MPVRSITVADVQEAARDRRVVKAHNYHVGRRGISWEEINHALEHCYHVAPDPRGDGQARPRHARGWFALASFPRNKRIRIDFDVMLDQDVLLLVVTAYLV